MALLPRMDKLCWLNIGQALQAWAALTIVSFAALAQAQFDTIINLPPDTAPTSIGSSTQVNLADGGMIGGFFNAGASDGFSTNVELNISGGTVGQDFVANSGSTVNISDGTLGLFSSARSGSEVNISGGIVEGGFKALPGSAINISGGTIHRSFAAFSGSDVELIGGEFRLNGADYTGSSVSVRQFVDGKVFTGTLADGSVFVFASVGGDRLSDATLTSAVLPAADQTPIIVDATNPSGPRGLRSGQALTLREGGTLDGVFQVLNATLNIEGGNAGGSSDIVGGVVNLSGGRLSNLAEFFDSTLNMTGGDLGTLSEATRSIVNISGGIVSTSFKANSGTIVNISGGIVGGGFDVNSGSVVNLSGGSLGDFSFVQTGSEVNIAGGTVGKRFVALSGGVVNVRGGTIGDAFGAREGSEVNLFGTEFFLDGAPLNNLVSNEVFVVTDRSVTLSGVLADGSTFSFDLNRLDSTRTGADFFSDNATLTITLVPEPSTRALLAFLLLAVSRHRTCCRHSHILM